MIIPSMGVKSFDRGVASTAEMELSQVRVNVVLNIPCHSATWVIDFPVLDPVDLFHAAVCLF